MVCMTTGLETDKSCDKTHKCLQHDSDPVWISWSIGKSVVLVIQCLLVQIQSPGTVFGLFVLSCVVHWLHFWGKITNFKIINSWIFFTEDRPRLEMHSHFIAMQLCYWCIDYLSITAQCNALHRKFTALQYRKAVVCTEMKIQLLQLNATQMQWSMNKALRWDEWLTIHNCQHFHSLIQSTTR